jgi:PIN domain nuclease of toxin-antitoxin system
VGGLSSRRHLTTLAVADTHTLVWALFGDARLSPATRAVLTVSGEGKVGVSAISFAEIVYLEEKQRLAGGIFARVAATLADPTSSLEEIPVDAAVIQAMTRIPRSSIPDLPDRIQAACRPVRDRCCRSCRRGRRLRAPRRPCAGCARAMSCPATVMACAMRWR